MPRSIGSEACGDVTRLARAFESATQWDRRRFSLRARADCHARPPAWRRPNIRRHAGDVRHGRGDRSAQYFYASRAFGRRNFDPSVHDRYGRLRRCCRDRPLASADCKRARVRGRRLDCFGDGVQCRCPTCCSARGAGRALAAYQAAISGGIALGSWVWGSIANVVGVEGAPLISGATLLASPVLGLWMRMPTVSGPNELSLDVLADPEVRLSLTPRSGPIIVEIEYRVDPAKARLFYALMQHVQLSRQRNGAYGWSIARDIADPKLWTERFHCPTWHDYLRQRSRSTATERALHVRANEFHIGPEPIRIRRMLERPIGSVRWKEDTPDRSTADVTPVTSPGSGP